MNKKNSLSILENVEEHIVVIVKIKERNKRTEIDLLKYQYNFGILSKSDIVSSIFFKHQASLSL